MANRKIKPHRVDRVDFFQRLRNLVRELPAWVFDAAQAEFFGELIDVRVERNDEFGRGNFGPEAQIDAVVGRPDHPSEEHV